MSLMAGGRAKRVRFYLNETDLTDGMPTPVWMVEQLRKHDAAGATLVRGGMGFGSSGRMHTLHIVDLAVDLPVIVEWIDEPARIDELLPEILAKVTPGLVTVEETFVALCAAQPVRDVPSDVAVAMVMARDPVCVDPATSVRDVVEIMRSRDLGGIPVVEDGIPLGIITGSDLITRAGLKARLSLLPGLDPAEVVRTLEHLPGVVARDIMTAPVVTISQSLALSQAATLMVTQKLKRLPVLDQQGKLVGIVSRVDLLGTVAHGPEASRASEPDLSTNGHTRLDKIMRRDAPTVFAHSSISEVIQAVVSTRLNRALVVDAHRRVVGLITAVELLQRVTPALRPSALSSLMHRLPFLHPTADQAESERHASARTARDLMTTEFVTAQPDTPLQSVISAMVRGTHKLVAVVDDQERLIGVVDRADVLRGLIKLYRD
jgi:CBS-domain-containing membrane protein/PII-like signaling protein